MGVRARETWNTRIEKKFTPARAQVKHNGTTCSVSWSYDEFAAADSHSILDIL